MVEDANDEEVENDVAEVL